MQWTQSHVKIFLVDTLLSKVVTLDHFSLPLGTFMLHIKKGFPNKMEFSVLTAVIIKITVFWDIMSYSPVTVDFHQTTSCYIPEDSTLL